MQEPGDTQQAGCREAAMSYKWILLIHSYLILIALQRNLHPREKAAVRRMEYNRWYVGDTDYNIPIYLNYSSV